MSQTIAVAARERRLLRNRSNRMQRVQSEVFLALDALPVRERVVVLHEVVRDVLASTKLVTGNGSAPRRASD